MNTRLRIMTILLVLVAVAAPSGAQTADADWAIAGGRFYTQTAGNTGRGYAVVDSDGVRFWSEFQRLGGVQAVGYPASQRFQWDGFTVQVFQRVVFQWRPEAGAVAFVNVFDRLHDLGKDDWLLQARQTPAPRPFPDAGKGWDEVVRDHLAVLDKNPAIRNAYFEVVGDPVQANGLPMSDVTDMGNHFALRAQRVVFQQWKQDVPWARAGQVTVALGGDISKEAGILPDPAALQPTDPSGAPTTSAAPTAMPAQPTLPPAPPTAVPTPAPGTLSGTVSGDNELRLGGRVELLDLPGLTAPIGQDGKYSLAGVPPGDRYVYVRDTQGSTSDPKVIRVSSGPQTVDLISDKFTPAATFRVVAGRVRSADGSPAGGATVWRLGDPSRTVTDADGNFWLAYDFQNIYVADRAASDQFPKPLTLVALKADRWGITEPGLNRANPGQAEIRLSRAAPAPAPPALVCDLVEQAPRARWSDAVLSNTGQTTDPRSISWNAPDPVPTPSGYARWVSGSTRLDDGSHPARGLLMHPRRVAGGEIVAISPPFKVGPSDFFVARVGFLQGKKGSAEFQAAFLREGGDPIRDAVQLDSRPIGPFQPNGEVRGLRTTNPGLSSGLLGQRGRIVLSVAASTVEPAPPDQNDAVWVDAQITRTVDTPDAPLSERCQ